MSTAEAERQRIRLEAYFAERNVAPADAKAEIRRLLQKYSEPSSGGFDKMWRNLARKYDGGETFQSTDPGVQASKAKQYDDNRIEQERVRLRKFYEIHAPEKLPDVDKNVKKYSRIANGFDDMWAVLARKYKTQPPAAGSAKSGGSRRGGDAAGGDNNNNASPRSDADGSVMGGGGGTISYASGDGISLADTGNTVESQRTRLQRFYEIHAPHKVGEVSALIHKYADPATGGYARMWQQLIDSYMPGAGSNNDEKLLASMLEDQRDRPGRRYPPAERAKWRQRLVKFYAYYAPEKGPEEVESILDRYGPPNGYDTMWSQLVDKYGPEPVAAPSGFVGRFMDEEDQDARRYEDEIYSRVGEKRPSPEPRQQQQQQQQQQQSAGRRDSPTRNFSSPLYSPDGGPPHLTTPSASPQQHQNGNDGGRAESVAPTDISTNADPERYPYSPLGFNAVAVVLHALLRLQGATVMLYEKANEERQKNFRAAVELEVALNLGIERRQVRVTAVKPGMAVELSIELTHEQVKHGVGEALVTRVLMGTFTVRHLRESYRRDLAGNPIQLHVEGAAIYGGACTPLFYDDAPHKPIIKEDPAIMLRSATRDVAEKWAREAAPEETISPPRWDNGARFQRGGALAPPALASPPRDGRDLRSASPVLSPKTDAGGDGPPNLPHSPLRGWGSGPGARQPSNPPPANVDWADDERRKNMRTLMNPHGLPSRPSTAPTGFGNSTSSAAAAVLPPRTSFLDQVWGRPAAHASPPFTTEARPTPRTVGGAPVGPLSMTTANWKERAHREMMKPVVLNPNPSTDDIPLPTRTAPPNVTTFRPEALMETHTSASTQFRRNVEDRRTDRLHASELLRAVRSPVEYQIEQQQQQSSRRQHHSSPLILSPSFDPHDPDVTPAARGGGSSPRRVAMAGPPTHGDARRDPMMAGINAQRSPSAVLDSRYQSYTTEAPADTYPRQERPRGPNSNASYLMDIVEALEV